MSSLAGLRFLEQLKRPEADHPSVARARAHWLIEAGRVEEGLRALEALEADHPLARADAVIFADLLTRAGRQDAAMSRYVRLLASDSRDSLVRLALARLHRVRGDDSAAVGLLQAGLDLQPFSAHFHAEMARLAQHRGQPAEARAAFQRALELAPWAAQWRVELASLELSSGRREAAQRVLDSALEASPILDRFRARHGLPAPENSEASR